MAIKWTPGNASERRRGNGKTVKQDLQAMRVTGTQNEERRFDIIRWRQYSLSKVPTGTGQTKSKVEIW